MLEQKYLIDANVLFNAFISGKEFFNLLFSQCQIYIPDFAFPELEKYKFRILKKTKLSESEFRDYVMRLFKNVTVIPKLLLSQNLLETAYKICKQVDEKDTVYIATAMEFDLTLITSDKKLYKGLQSRGFNRIIQLSEIVNILYDR